MAVKLSPLYQPDSAQVDANGAPRSGAKLFTYLAGSSTKVTTYKDSAGSVQHTNPILLEANGLTPAPIWLSEGSTYKFVLAPSTDTDPPTSPYSSPDNIVPINDVAATTATEWTASGMTPTYISATSFSVPGDQTSLLEIGRRLKSNVTAGTIYSTITKSVYTTLTTITVENDSGTLDSGLSALSYGQASVANTSLPFVSRDQQSGRLIRVSATQIRLDPHDGNTIWLFIGGAWRRRTIPSAGVTAANTSIYIDGTSGQNLLADSTYYVYLWDNAGTLTMDFSTTAPAVDATSGLRIKTGVATRALIGMTRTNASSQFELALSWYNRRGIRKSASLTATRSTTSTTYVELHSELRVGFLAWGEETIAAAYTGYAYQSTSNFALYTGISLDGSVAPIVETVITAITSGANYPVNVSQVALSNVTEGYHYLTVVAAVNANQGNWSLGTLSVVSQG